jgi:hypothetical protein
MWQAMCRQSVRPLSATAMRRDRRLKRQPAHLRHYDVFDDAYFEEWMMAYPIESATA